MQQQASQQSLGGFQFEFRPDQIDNQSLQGIIQELQNIFTDLKNIHTSKVVIIIDGIPQQKRIELQVRVNKLQDQECVQTNQERSLIDDSELTKIYFDKSRILDDPALYDENSFRSIIVNPDQNKMFVYSKSERLQAHLKTQLQTFFSLIRAPSLDFQEGQLLISLSEGKNSHQVIKFIKEYFQNFRISQVENKNIPEFSSYIQKIKERTNIQVVYNSKSQPLKGYFNSEDSPVQSTNYYLYSEQFEDQSQYDIKRLDDIIHCDSIHQTNDLKTQFFDEFYVPMLSLWMKKSMFTTIQQNRNQSQVFYLRLQKYSLIGPRSEVNQIKNLVEFETTRLSIQVFPILVNKADSSLTKLLKSQIEIFMTQTRDLQFFDANIFEGEINTIPLFKSFLKDLYDNYLSNAQIKVCCCFQFWTSKSVQQDILCNRDKDSLVYNMLKGETSNQILRLQQQEKSDLESCIVAAFIAPNSKIPQLQKTLDETVRLDTQYFKDKNIIDLSKSKKYQSQFRQIQQSRGILVQIINEGVKIIGRENQIQMAIKDFYDLQRISYQHDFQSRFILNNVKKNFNNNLQELKINYNVELKSNIIDCRMEFELPQIHLSIIKSQLDQITNQIDEFKVFKHRIKSKLNPNFFKSTKLQQIENDIAVQINLVTNEILDYVVHSQYKLNESCLIRICSGSYAQQFKDKMGQNFLANSAIIVPIKILNSQEERNYSSRINEIIKLTQSEIFLKEQIIKMTKSGEVFCEFQKTLSLATKEFIVGQEVQDDSKQNDKKSIFKVFTYFGLFEDQQDPLKFFNYFDKITQRKSIGSILDKILNENLVNRIIVIQDSKFKLDPQIMGLILFKLNQKSTKKIKTCDIVVETEDQQSEISAMIKELGTQYDLKQKSIISSDYNYTDVSIKAYDYHQMQQALEKLILLSEQYIEAD